MASSKAGDYYDALAATTSIEDMTDNEDNQWTLRSLKNNDKDLSRLRLCIYKDASLDLWSQTIFSTFSVI